MINSEKKKQNDLDHYIFAWQDFPIDYWWRKKYNISFGSIKHRDMNFIDMLIDYREDLLIRKEINRLNIEKEEKENKELGIDKNNEVKLTDKQIKDDYDNLDLSEYNKKKK
mgnify:CR=1 FL=1|jgi:hypothetical protein